MEDFSYVFAVAFSGADLTRAVWIGLVGSLFCTRALGPVRVTCALFLIDRAWPFVMMGLSGYGMDAVGASLAYALETLPKDATTLVFRFAGLFALCMTGYALRLMLHRAFPVSRKLTAPY